MTKWLDCSLIQSKISYCLCLSQKEYFQVLRKIGIDPTTSTAWVPEDRAGSAHHWYTDDSQVTIVCVNTEQSGFKEDPICLAGIMVHEAVHIWQEFCESIGEKNPSREFEAYSIQWISQQLMWEYARGINKNSAP